MKRTVALLAGAVTLGAMVYVGSQVLAQNGNNNYGVRPAAAHQPPRTRIALINLQYVVKNYKKWDAYQAEFKRDAQIYEDRLKQKKALFDRYQLDIKNPQVAADAAQRDRIEKEMKGLQREMQDIKDEAQRYIGDKEGHQVATIYQDVTAAVTEYARSRDIELVMHYNDAVAEADKNNPMNIGRKMSAGACMPLYVADGMDISQEVTAMLNSRYQPQQQQRQSGAPGTPTSGSPLRR